MAIKTSQIDLTERETTFTAKNSYEEKDNEVSGTGDEVLNNPVRSVVTILGVTLTMFFAGLVCCHQSQR